MSHVALLEYRKAMAKLATVVLAFVLPSACLAQLPSTELALPRFEDITKQAGITVTHLSSPEKR